MAQITIYMPDEVAERLKRAARRAKQSLSAYLTALVTGEGASDGWPPDFFDLAGSCRGTLELPADPPPEETSAW